MIIASPTGQPVNRKPALGGQQPKASVPSLAERNAKQAAIIQAAIATDPRLPKSVSFQVRNRGGLSNENYERAMEDKNYCLRIKNEMQTLRDGIMWQYRDHFEHIVANENNNIDFYNGYQWSDDQLRDIQILGLTPLKSNFMSRWARTLLGEQRGAETIYQMANFDPSSKDEADFWNDVLYRIARHNRWSAKDGQNFFNYTVGGRGFTSVKRHPHDPDRRIELDVHRPQEFMYDLDNAKNGSLDGCNYLTRIYLKDLEELIHENPFFETELSKIDQARFHSDFQYHFTLSTPKVHPTKKKLHLPHKLKPYGDYLSRRSAWVTEFYQRGGRKVWAVRDIFSHLDYEFETIEQAVHFYRVLRDARIYQIASEGFDPTGIELVIPPKEIVSPQVTKYLWVGDLLVQCEQQKGERFPYQAVHCDFHMGGTFRGWLEDDKDNQLEQNRIRMLVDLALSGVKGKTLYNESYFPKGTQQKDIEEMLVRPTKAIRIKAPIGTDLSRVIHHEPAPQLGPQLGVMKDLITENSNHLNGGLNVAGQAAFAGQSAKHSQAMLQQSAAGTVPLFMDFKEHGVLVAEAMVENAQHLEPTALLEMVAPENRMRYLAVINNGFQTAKDNRYIMEVNEVRAGPTKRDADAALLVELALNDPNLGGDIAPELMELRGLPAPMRERIEARRAEREARELELAQMEQQTAQYEAQMKWGLAEEDRAIAWDKNDIMRNPPIKQAVSWKPPTPGPAMVATFMEQSGNPADPDIVASDLAAQKLMDQAERDMMQEHANARTPAWEKNKGKGSGTQGKSNGPRSSKDQIARKSKRSENTR